MEKWCCRRGLNSRPHPYQGCALPLSYRSAGRAGGRCGRADAIGQSCKRQSGRFLPPALEHGRMAEKPRKRSRPRPSDKSREDRLKAALKANLPRRKAQARARKTRTNNNRTEGRAWIRSSSRASGPLNGEIPIAGAKNACLTLMPATLLQRRAADADQRAAAVGHPHHDRAAAIARRRGGALQDGQVLAMSSHDLTSHARRLRHRAQDARLDPGAGAAAGARRAGGGVAARRLRHRRAAGGPAPAGRWRRWAPSWSCATAMCTPRRRGGLKGRTVEFPLRLGRRDRERADGGDAGQGHHGARRTPRASPRSSIWRTACADGRADRGRGHAHHHHPGRRPAARRDPPGRDRPDRAGHLHAGPRDLRRRGRPASAAGSTCCEAFCDKLRRGRHRRAARPSAG